MTNLGLPWFLVLIGLWGLVVVWLLGLIKDRYQTYSRYSWYTRPSGKPNSTMEWNDIRELIDIDPPKNTSQRRNRPWLCIIADLFRLVSVVLIVLGSLSIIFCWTIVEFWICTYTFSGPCAQADACVTCPLLNRSELIGFSGTVGAAAIGAVIAAFYQIRLKARAQNRADWIHSVRQELTFLLSNIPACDTGTIGYMKARHQTKENMVRLELLLNPDERVHRSCLAVIRFMYRIDGVTADEEARENLGMTTSPYRSSLEGWNHWNAKAVKLAQILLKREWEQVKRAE